MNRSRFLAAGLLVVLLMAGLGSYYASSHPDGLEFVARKTGFIDRKESSTQGPFAGYQTKGIGDPLLSGGVAGVAGSLLVLMIGGGLFWVLRRRDADPAAGEG